MKYFSKNKKWMAYLILLTFLFTSVMPSNLGSMNSIAEAAITPESVDVVNSAAAGITITMTNIPGSDEATRPFRNGGWIGGAIQQGLVELTLEDGYPKLTEERKAGSYNQVVHNKRSLKDCFSNADGYPTLSVNGLFLQSEYDETGYYHYSSFDNSAILNNGKLEVYRELMTPEPNTSDVLYGRGNFLPYNNFSQVEESPKQVRFDENGGSISNGRTDLYVLKRKAENSDKTCADFHFGMMVSAAFTQPQNGRVTHTKPDGTKVTDNMRYEFTGDDDLWVFIDDVLILDLGGVHVAHSGSIDFVTGEVEIDGEKDTTIGDQFRLAYRNDSAKLAEAEKSLKDNTFADFTEHTIKIFYMERGEGASDLKMRFNLPTVPANPELQKIVEVNEEFINPEKAYQFDVKVSETGAADDADVADQEAYTGRVIILDQNDAVVSDGTISDGTITLKHGETAALKVDKGEFVRFEETNGTDDFTKHNVTQTDPATGNQVTLENRTENTGVGKKSDWHQIEFTNAGEKKLFYQFFNTVDKADLTITKQLEGITDTETEFQFKVYFKNSVGENDLVKQMPNWTLYQGELDSSSTGRIDAGVIYLNAGEKAVLKDIPVGTEYFVEEVLGSNSNYVVKNENLQTAVASGEEDAVKASGNLAVGTEGIYGSIIIVDSNNDEKNDDINVVITNTKLGDIEFTKTDGTKPLAGATFSLYSDAECTTAVEGYTEIASDENGIVRFTDVPYGTYYLKEIDFDGGNDNQVTIGGKTYAVNPTVYYKAVVGASVTISDAAGNQIADKKVVNNEVTTEISGEKIWANVPDTVTKPSVTIGLYDGTTKVKEVTLDGTTDSNGEYEAWKYKVTVPKYKNGTEIDYTVKEIDVGNVSVTENTTKTDTNAATGYYNITVNGKNITNSYVKDVTATKTWNDGNAQNRPAIEVKLYNGSAEVEVKPTTVTDGNVTTYTWTGVPANGTYTVKEYSVGEVVVPYEGDSNVAVVTVAGQKYKVENNGLTITNTLLTDISGTKTWNNANNTWPTGATVTVGLYADSNAVTVNGVAVTDTLAGADDVTYSFTNLPRYTAGSSTPIGYTVKELDANGVPVDTVTVGSDTYKVSYDGNNIINTLTGEADITVTKTWDDDNDRDGLREAITVVLQQKVGSDNWADVASLPDYNNETQQVTQEIALSDNMSHTWHNVPLYTTDGAEILYRVVENPVKEGYEASYANSDVDDVYTNGIGAKASNREVKITNTHRFDTARIKIEKVWDDKGLTVHHADLIFDIVGKVGETVVYENTVTLNSNNEWAASEDVPKNATGQAITYLISERNVPEGYEVSYKLNNAAVNSDVVTWNTGAKNVIGIILAWLTGESQTDGIDCHVKATNTLKTADIQLTKEYDGPVPDNKAAFILTETNNTNASPITLTRDGDVYRTTGGALKYGVDYTLTETAPAGYNAEGPWALRFDCANGADQVVLTGKTANTALNWVNEGNRLAALGTITNNVKDADFVFTKAFNSSVKAEPVFTVTEAVAGSNNYGESAVTVVKVEGETSQYKLEGLKYGKTYKVVEKAPNYEEVTFYLNVTTTGSDVTAAVDSEKGTQGVWSNENGWRLTNQIKETDLTLTKTYDSNPTNRVNEKDVAVFFIKENGASDASPEEVTLNDGKYVFTGLESGKTYTVTETAPAGFKPVEFKITVTEKANGAVVAAIEGYEANQDGSYTVNNKIKTESLTFDKVYVGPQPAAKATFNVTNNKDDVKDTLKANAEGSYTMANLKYGYTYSVVENAPEGYVPVAFTVAVGTDGELTVSQTKADGYETIDAIETADGVVTVKNYLKQDKVDLFGTKSWIGGTTDSAIEIKLFRDGAEQATTTTSIKFNWKYIFAGLDRFNLETGKAYEYTVVETPLDGFTAHYDETVTADGIQIDITNVKDEETVAISGQKVWHDVAGTKHEPIEIALYRSTGTEDGKELVEKVTLSDEKGWTYNFGLLPKADPDSHIYYKYEVVELNVPAGYVSVVNGYDVHNIATPLYELGDISVTKKVVGTPANPNAVYDFVLYVKATVKGTLDSAQQKLQAALVDDYLRLRDKELPAAEDAKEAAKAAFESSVFLTATSASAYTFFLTDESDNAVMGLTTGSAYYVDHVAMPLKKTEAAPANLIGALITAIEELAEEFLNAIAEDPAAAKPTQSVMLSRIAQNSSVMKEAAAVNAVTTSAIAFKADNMQGLFDSVVTHKTTLQEYQDAKAAWEAFDTSVTTPTAIVLVVNGDFDHPIELDPEKGRQSETDENILEFTVENGEYTETVRFNTATSQYEIPFSLLKDETIKFNMKAATGSAIEYYIIEDRPVDDNYDHTDIKAYLYNGSLKDLENTMKAEEYLNTLTSTTSKLTSGSAATYEFYNHYEEDTPPGGGFTPEPPKKPEPPKPPEEIIDDPEVPLDAPEVPEEPVVVPGEEILEPEVPLGDAPATGDAANAVPFMVLMMFALCGLVVTRRKFN